MTAHTDNLPTFDTTLAALAAYIILNGYGFKKLEKRDPKRNTVTFCFEDLPRLLVIEFNNGNARVEPLAFAGKLSDLIQEARRLNTSQGQH